MSRRPPPASCYILLIATLCYFFVCVSVAYRLRLSSPPTADIRSPLGPLIWLEFVAAIVVPLVGASANVLMIFARASFGLLLGWLAVVWMLGGTVCTGALLYANEVTSRFFRRTNCCLLGLALPFAWASC